MSDVKLRVLVLDDEPIVGRRIKPALEKFGVEVEVSVDPEEALRLAASRPFDVVVTDVKMRKMDGMQVLERILVENQTTKVIVITGFASTELAREALTKGAFEFITKPFKADQLRAAVSRAAKALGRPQLPGFENV